MLQDPVIKAIADRIGRTIGQVIIHWLIELGTIPLPKAASEARQIENPSIFDFSLMVCPHGVIRLEY
ncbi:hypothetical protein [Pseudochelatococcus sp. G4_1912]|uniref:hypothetical protein n=1 Tax=Pseudochelatococcus sp. G4_1912 TaxID=3114288 RepID=UPI0039C5B92C